MSTIFVTNSTSSLVLGGFDPILSGIISTVDSWRFITGLTVGDNVTPCGDAVVDIGLMGSKTIKS